jgi:ribosomal protein S8
MKKGSKSNISILRDYVDGVRPFVQVGYSPSTIEKNPGSTWTDSKGITWKQENGYKKRVNKQADLIHKITEEKCSKCKSDIKWGSKLDKIFFNRTGLCENCLIDYETKLRIVGVYPYYEVYKMISYEIGSIKNAKEKISEVIKFFSESSGDVEMICNSEGFIERWKNTNKNEILSEAKKDLKLASKRIIELSKIKTKAKKEYQKGAKKFQLEGYV